MALRDTCKAIKPHHLQMTMDAGLTSFEVYTLPASVVLFLDVH